MVDFQNVVFQRIDVSCGGSVVIAVEFEFFPAARTLPLIPPKGVRDVYQFSTIVIHTAIFECIEGVVGEAWRQMKREEEEEEEEGFHFVGVVNKERINGREQRGRLSLIMNTYEVIHEE